MTASKDAEVLSWIEAQAVEDEGLGERWARFVRWAGTSELEHRREIRRLAEDGGNYSSACADSDGDSS